MFYSADLLQKSGPLARVWMSANLERKLSKNHILQSSVADSVEAIITPGQAPMALRLSSQLLLGVVRIYQRKTRYLLDDCNEAMMKIKMAFRSSGNNDMSASMQVHNREALVLPDKITPYDNLDLPPPPDPSWLLSQVDEVSATPIGRKGRASNRDINLQEDYENSQFLYDDPLNDEGFRTMDGLDLGLDLGLDDMEIGRDAPAARGIGEDMISEFDIASLTKPGAGRDESVQLDFTDDGIQIADDEGDIIMDENFNFNADDQSAMPTMGAGPDVRARISESPLSDIDDDFARRFEHDRSRNQTDLYEPEDETEQPLVRRPTQRAKKQKVMAPDDEIALSSTHIKQQQADRSNILREPSFLPRNPYLLSLLEMQKSGGFVTNIIMDGRSSVWAPELQGMLGMDFRGAGDHKRKRDSGVADVESDPGAKSPRLELGEDTEIGIDGQLAGDQSVARDSTIIGLPDDDALVLPEDEGMDTLPAFEDTTMPLVHPSDSGPVSLGTKHAVHVLRDIFGSEAATNAEKRKKAVVFQDLVPEQRTTKAEATKMFFECLVLATKDAIKVEQGAGLGDPIKVRGKRGLWGAWAEREAGGEIQEQDEPEHVIAQAPAVAVGA
ncbi:hypothetical protein CC79DRAFT_1330367 [Sarocladium strictum]